MPRRRPGADSLLRLNHSDVDALFRFKRLCERLAAEPRPSRDKNLNGASLLRGSFCHRRTLASVVARLPDCEEWPRNLRQNQPRAATALPSRRPFSAAGRKQPKADHLPIRAASLPCCLAQGAGAFNAQFGDTRTTSPSLWHRLLAPGDLTPPYSKAGWTGAYGPAKMDSSV